MLAEDFAELRASHSDCVVRSSHQAALQKEKNELSRVNLELEQTKKAKADAESAWAEERRLQVEGMRELRENLAEDSARASTLEKQVDALKTKPNEWLSELKFSSRVLPLSLFKHFCSDSADLTRP